MLLKDMGKKSYCNNFMYILIAPENSDGRIEFTSQQRIRICLFQFSSVKQMWIVLMDAPINGKHNDNFYSLLHSYMTAKLTMVHQLPPVWG